MNRSRCIQWLKDSIWAAQKVAEESENDVVLVRFTVSEVEKIISVLNLEK